MTVQALGYIGVRAKEPGGLGQLRARTSSACSASTRPAQSMAFRMDDRKQRLVVDADGGQGIGFFGWEVADAAALDAVARAAGEDAAPRSRAARARSPTSGTSRT